MLGGIVMFGLLVGGVVLFIHQAKRNRGPIVPTCGKCGYNVFALSTFICPECGSDLREVGIEPSRQKSVDSSLTMDILGWTLLMLLTTMFVSGWLPNWALWVC